MAIPIPKIEAFDLHPGRVLGGKYVIEEFLGSGWEGEVYRVCEQRTGIRRAAKLFFPQRNVRDRAVRYYARKMDRLRKCSIVIQYHHSESFRYRRTLITYLISDLVEGEILAEFIKRQRGKRLQPFEALHLIHTLARGMEQIHQVREYHGDVHDGNVLVKRRGIGFDLKLVDFFHHTGRPSRSNIRDDVVEIVRLLYDAVGGQARYAAQPPEIKSICRGLRRTLIVKKFPTAGHLRRHLESFTWA